MNQNTAERVRTGATVRALREANGWRLGKFATAIGVSHAYLANIEAGRRRLPVDLARQVATTLNVPLAAITTTYDVDEVA
ncbi:MAG: helix-turn-helix transcriptional regulator [Salana multivorans]|uniref:helix-turn-helix domain-containing protein n=1 Tax=Salana multivorans TaxID=120377 RepID=UPI00095CA2FD|nr:helix-turn-helix transcriptional regulator [Salana multivorans]MBN8883343.1 helix-turn-helix transcriptional regulator [Salana multivorans]OJX98429.1 MAG: transcriptional regulator [Micrococcales bacterium 73-15]